MSTTPGTLSTARPEQSARRRQQLINATILTIAEHGLSRTTLARVARTAGSSTGIVNFYFRSKDDLLLAVLQSLAAESEASVAAAVAGAPGPAQALLRLVDAYFDPQLSAPAKVAVWFAFWGETRARREYMRICGDTDRVNDETVQRLFRALPGVDGERVKAQASAFVGLLDSLWQQILWDGEEFDRAHARAVCEDYLRSVASDAFADGAATPARAGVAAAGEATTMPTSAHATLAPWTYRSAELFALEQEQLFRRNWLLAGHVSEIPHAGDYLTFDVAGERALLLRGDDGTVRAFHNVCRHRGSCVVRPGAGTCDKLIVCPFHGWAYGLDGKLRGVPAQKTFAGLEREAEGLVPIALEIWRGFAFVRFAGAGPGVAEQMAPVAREIAPHRLAELQPLQWLYRGERSVNWKLVHDVDNEGYHVPVGHPALQTLYGNNYYDSVVSERVTASYGTVVEEPSPYWSVRAYQRILPEFDYLPSERQRLWAYYGLFPNLVIAVYPEMVEYYQTIPLTPERTLFVSKTYGLPDTRREVRAARWLNTRINTEVGREDERFVEWLAEAMRSSVFPRNHLSSIEAGVANFHQQIRRALPLARLEHEPRSA